MAEQQTQQLNKHGIRVLDPKPTNKLVPTCAPHAHDYAYVGTSTVHTGVNVKVMVFRRCTKCGEPLEEVRP